MIRRSHLTHNASHNSQNRSSIVSHCNLNPKLPRTVSSRLGISIRRSNLIKLGPLQRQKRNILRHRHHAQTNRPRRTKNSLSHLWLLNRALTRPTNNRLLRLKSTHPRFSNHHLLDLDTLHNTISTISRLLAPILYLKLGDLALPQHDNRRRTSRRRRTSNRQRQARQAQPHKLIGRHVIVNLHLNSSPIRRIFKRILLRSRTTVVHHTYPACDATTRRCGTIPRATGTRPGALTISTDRPTPSPDDDDKGTCDERGITTLPEG